MESPDRLELIIAGIVWCVFVAIEGNILFWSNIWDILVGINVQLCTHICKNIIFNIYSSTYYSEKNNITFVL